MGCPIKQRLKEEKTMNAVTISILSLLLALTASGSGDVASKKTTDSQEQLQTAKDKTDGSFWGSLLGVNLNHNETLVRDTQFKPTTFERTLEPEHPKLVTCRQNYEKLLREMNQVAAKN